MQDSMKQYCDNVWEWRELYMFFSDLLESLDIPSPGYRDEWWERISMLKRLLDKERDRDSFMKKVTVYYMVYKIRVHIFVSIKLEARLRAEDVRPHDNLVRVFQKLDTFLSRTTEHAKKKHFSPHVCDASPIAQQKHTTQKTYVLDFIHALTGDDMSSEGAHEVMERFIGFVRGQDIYLGELRDVRGLMERKYGFWKDDIFEAIDVWVEGFSWVPMTST